MCARGGGLVALIAAAGILVGCSGSGGEPPPLDIDAIASSTSAFQRVILSDGEVSPSEYEEALLAYRTCVEDAGAEPSEIYATGNNEKGFDYEVVAADDDEVERINALAEKCLPEYFADVGKVWAYQQLLSPEEIRDLRPAVAECLRGVGLDVDDDVTLEDITALVEESADPYVIQPCVEAYPGFFSVAPDPSKSHDDESHADHG